MKVRFKWDTINYKTVYGLSINSKNCKFVFVISKYGVVWMIGKKSYIKNFKFAVLKYCYKILTKPLNTVFTINNIKVNRIKYLRSTLEEINK